MNSNHHSEMLDLLRETFKTQDLPYEGIIKESAPAQFEINMAHSDDVMLMADQIIRMQRCIRRVASQCNLIASFMPKPLDNEAGNGMHIHCSVLEERGLNIFNDGNDEGSPLLKQAIAGCLELMPDAMPHFCTQLQRLPALSSGQSCPYRPNLGL